MKKILLLTLALGTLLSFAQTKKIDSLKNVLKTLKDTDTNRVKVLNEIGWKLTQRDDSSATAYSEEALRLAGKLKFNRGIIRAHNNLGIFAMNISDYPKAHEHLNAALELSKKLNYAKGQGIAHTNIGNVYFQQGNYPEALRSHLSALKTYELHNDKGGISTANNNLGGQYVTQGKYEEALKCYTKSLALKRELKDSMGMANTLGNIATVFVYQKKYKEALPYYLDAEKVYERTGNAGGLAMCLGNLGLNYSYLQDYEQSEKYLRKAVELDKSLNNRAGTASNSTRLAEVLIYKKQFPEAKKYLDEALRISQEVGHLETIKSTWLALNSYHSQTGDYKSALDDYRNYIVYRDSLNNEEVNKKNVEAKIQYEYDKREALNQLEQEKKDAVAAQEKQKQRMILVLVIAVLLIVIVFSVFLFKRFKVTQRQKKIIEDQKGIVEKKNDIIEQKQKEIYDSINYAKRIQDALIAGEQLLNEHLGEHFVLFQPKDIVSGDFYWATHVVQNNVRVQEGLSTSGDERFYLAVCDSTGHGIPGAFMSLLNMGFLREAINEKGIISPDEIFNFTRQRLIDNISKEGQKDGFDGVLICMDRQKKQITYAAANNFPVLVRNGVCTELEGDRMPVGKGEKKDSFRLFSISYQSGDILYLYTDGYADQFGGAKGKKFKYRQLNDLLGSVSSESMSIQKEKLADAFSKWRGELEQVDDVCVIGIRL